MRRAEENNEKAELAVAEPHRVPIASSQASRVEVQLPAIETVGADAFRPALVHLGPAPAQHRTDACEELARAERLGQVIVGAQLQPHHPISLFAATGEHDDRYRRLFAQAASER